MGSTFIGTPVVPATIPVIEQSCGGTWLSLDRWAQIMGMNPLGFHQLSSPTMMLGNTCGEVTFQSSWQHSDRVGREDICMAIKEAELQIAQEVGYNLLPDWTVDERLPYPRTGQPGVYNQWGINPNGQFKSVEPPRGYLISGGIRTKTLVRALAPITRSDADGDGFLETCTLTVPTSVTDINEIRVYYPGQNAADGWEVRPIQVSISGGVATITFKVWQVALASAMFAFDPQPLDADDPDSYETTVDVYRLYNDPSTQVTMIWEGDVCNSSCNACQLGAQSGCFHLRDARLGILVPAPANWDAATSQFVATEFSMCREPDQVRLWYYSGFRDNTRSRPYVEMSFYWETAVAYFAASKLDRPVCGCSNVAEFVEKWRRDAMFSDKDSGGFVMTPEFLANRLGTSIGALYAYRRIHQNGVRINK